MKQHNSARLTVIDTVFHQTTDVTSPPFSLDKRYTEELTSDEQVYSKKLVVGAEWVRLSAGWVEKCSLIHLSNDEGLGRTTIPSKEELEDTAKCVVEVGFTNEANSKDPQFMSLSPIPVIAFLLFPGKTCRGIPFQLSNIWLRCQYKSAKCKVSFFPA